VKQSFWDTLIDRLEQDIHREVARAHDPAHRRPRADSLSESRSEDRAESVDWKLMASLNLRLGGPRQFNVHRRSQTQTANDAAKKSTQPKRPVSQQNLLSSAQSRTEWSEPQSVSAAPQPVWPEVYDVETLTVFELLRRFGLAFFAADLDSTSPIGVKPKALSRERRRLLAENHPDRAHAGRNASDPQVLADLHSRFTTIADLFDRLSSMCSMKPIDPGPAKRAAA